MSDAGTRDDRDATDPFDADRSEGYDDGEDGDGEVSGTRDDVMAGWLASTAIRWVLLFVGVVLLLFALGQAFDTPFLGWLVDAATSETGRWLVVALVALGIIALATNAPWDSWH